MAIPRATALAALAVVVGLGAIYVTKAPPGNGPLPTVASGDVKSDAKPVEGPSGDPIGAFIRKPAPAPLPNVAFQNAEGQPVDLASFKGRVVLLNLWATWCIPCRKEMPALDRLQAALGSNDFEVVALSIDRSGIAGTRKFLDSIGVARLRLYVDPSAKLANEFKAVGLPTTLLIDRQGREIGRLIGPAEWDDADAKKLVQMALAVK